MFESVAQLNAFAAASARVGRCWRSTSGGRLADPAEMRWRLHLLATSVPSQLAAAWKYAGVRTADEYCEAVRIPASRDASLGARLDASKPAITASSYHG
jgi:hypothetical protein